MTVEEKRLVAPAVVIAGLDADALAGQSMQDFRTVERVDSIVSLGETPGRYALFVVRPDVFRRSLRRNKHLLLQLLVDMELRELSMNLVSVGASDPIADRAVVAMIASTILLLHHPNVPQSRDGLLRDLVCHARALCERSAVGETQIGSEAVNGGLTVAQALSAPAATKGYRATPPAWLDGRVTNEIHAKIRLRPETDSHPVTFKINDFYGHAHVLRAYCGTSALPIHGQVQHGWTVPSYHAVVGQDPANDVALLWSEAAVKPDQRAYHIIGAPYLYLPDAPDGGPLWPNGLLAVPSHGIAQHPLIEPWDGYADWLSGAAARRGLSPVTVCLHPNDWTDEATRAFAARGVRAVACSSTLDRMFLHQFRSFVRQHAWVTTNRIGTPAFYALHENRPLFIGGPSMGTTPPDRGEEVTSDGAWARERYPTLFVDGLAGKGVAAQELGVVHKRAPNELRRILFGWYYGDDE